MKILHVESPELTKKISVLDNQIETLKSNFTQCVIDYETFRLNNSKLTAGFFSILFIYIACLAWFFITAMILELDSVRKSDILKEIKNSDSNIYKVAGLIIFVYGTITRFILNSILSYYSFTSIGFIWFFIVIIILIAIAVAFVCLLDYWDKNSCNDLVQISLFILLLITFAFIAKSYILW